MIKKRLFIYGLLAVLAAAVFYYHPFVENIYLFSREKIQDFGKNSLASLGIALEKEISAPPPLRSEKESARSYLTQKGVFEQTNIEREKNGTKPLEENSKLDQAALKKARDILAKKYFEHVSPEGNGPDYFVSGAGYEYLTVGENLALGNFADDAELVSEWMASPGHRENILRTQFQEIGIAVLRGTYEGKMTWVAVQEFGTPLAVCPVVDESLKEKIDRGTNQIEELSNELKNQKAEIKKMNPRGEGYSQSVEDYNILVEKYNALIVKTKNLIETYNDQVQNYNTCVKSF